ncbi:Hypothetical predicted protein [Octopus vulgaris]|uniref:Uncharacterized protein n=1 Tax=Octopus vulgaris TaxID=6645 RepID=A0AA36FAR3_OCTVU|nr:Hypothetical predicted protein [Octopus vulgaris]
MGKRRNIKICGCERNILDSTVNLPLGKGGGERGGNIAWVMDKQELKVKTIEYITNKLFLNIKKKKGKQAS